ncbi:MAG: Tll0287-like domain-containing protein [Hyphomicrobiaceae bacterium]
MIRIGIFIAVTLFAQLTWAEEARNVDVIEAKTAFARSAVTELASRLKSQLVKAIKANGPASAIPVCNVAAPTIAKDISDKLGGRIARTALKLRNPKNAPDIWEQKNLEHFAKQIEAGADVKTLEHFEVVKHDGRSSFRYMKAITTGKPCLTCHGTGVAPALLDTIRDLYPEDKAVGFTPGSLRGAFTVTLPVN